MSERLKFLGQLEEYKIEFRKLDLEIKDHRMTLRDLLDPFAEPEKLDGQRIAMRAVQLASNLLSLRRLREKIAALKEELGLKDDE